MAMDRLWMWPWKRSIDMDHHGGDSGGSIVSIGNGKKYTMISRGRLTTLFVLGCLNVSFVRTVHAAQWLYFVFVVNLPMILVAI